MKKDKLIKIESLEDEEELEKIEFEVLCKEYGEEEAMRLMNSDVSDEDSLKNIDPELYKEMMKEFEDTYGKEFDEELDAIIEEVLNEEN